jgi:hypothetical protein
MMLQISANTWVNIAHIESVMVLNGSLQIFYLGGDEGGIYLVTEDFLPDVCSSLNIDLVKVLAQLEKQKNGNQGTT